MNKRNCVSALVCAAVFVYFLIQSNALPEAAAYWPKIVCIVGLTLSGLEIVLEGVKWGKATGEQEKLWVLTPQQTKNSLIVLGLMILWIAGLTTIGFMVSSAAALCVVAVMFEPVKTKGHIIRDIVVCALFGVALYYVFQFLGVHFPRTLLM